MEKNYRPVDDGDDLEIDIIELLGAVLSKIWIVIGSAVVMAAAAYLICSFLVTPRYESTTKIYVINRQNSDSLTYSDLQTGSQLTKDYQELVTSRPVLEEVKAELGLDIENDRFKKMITVSVPTDTRIVSITAEDTDPYMARAIADRVRISAAQHIANVMNTEAVNVVEEANLPTEISSPKIIRNTAIGGVIGAFIAVMIIVIIYIMDDTIKNPDDVEKYLGLSVLGSIPVLDEELVRNNTKKGKKKKKVSNHNHVVMTETLSDASKLVREAKAASLEDGLTPEFIEPKEPIGIDRERRGDRQ
ncbi:MAG: protein-tyrosine kinase [Lachnospiraceae bacterium]|nr:protein-tyrosine kinase [Lachnospiraceae bacterium]